MKIASAALSLYRLKVKVQDEEEKFLEVMASELKRGQGRMLAGELGVSDVYISDLKNGRRTLGIALLYRLSKVTI